MLLLFVSLVIKLRGNFLCVDMMEKMKERRVFVDLGKAHNKVVSSLVSKCSSSNLKRFAPYRFLKSSILISPFKFYTATGSYHS